MMRSRHALILLAAWLGAFLAGLLITALAIAVYAIGGHATPIWAFGTALALFGFSVGLHYPQMMRVAMQSSPEDRSIEASTAMSSVRSVAQLLGIVAFETMFSQIYLKPDNPDYGSSTNAQSVELMNSGFSIAFTVGIVICLAAVVPLLFLGRSEKELVSP